MPEYFLGIHLTSAFMLF